MFEKLFEIIFVAIKILIITNCTSFIDNYITLFAAFKFWPAIQGSRKYSLSTTEMQYGVLYQYSQPNNLLPLIDFSFSNKRI